MHKQKILPVLVVALALSCTVYAEQPGRLVGETDLGTTKAAHSLTRGHNRKIIFDTTYQHWYLFWLRDDGMPTFNPEEEGVVYQISRDGLTWSRPVVMEPFQNGGITAWDVIWSGRSLYVLGLTDYPNSSGKVSKYAVRELRINPDGRLTIHLPRVIYDNSGGNNASVHFYGSLLQDGQGYFWVAARVGDSTPGTHAEVIRSTNPGNLAAWGTGGMIGPACNDKWQDPYAKSGRIMLRGTIASLAGSRRAWGGVDYLQQG
jgi:hypothetical protein